MSETDELTDEELIRLAAVLCRGKVELRALTYDTDGWRSLVDREFLRYSFVPWGRRQYSVMAKKKTEAAVMDDIARAASIAADHDLHDVADFLIMYMSPGHLPELLSHEDEAIREAAADRLEELAKSIANKK